MPDPLADFPNRFQNGPGNLPDADQVMEDYDHIRDYLNARLGNLSSGQILVADASGQIVGRTVSGAFTISASGVTSMVPGSIDTTDLADAAVTTPKIGLAAVGSAQIANDAVQTGKIADGAVTELKLANGAATGGKVDLDTISETLATDTPIPVSFGSMVTNTPPAGTYLITATVVAAGAGGGTWEPGRHTISVRLTVGGSATAENHGTVGPLTTDFVSIPYVHLATVNGSQVVALQASGNALDEAKANSTRMRMVRIA